MVCPSCGTENLEGKKFCKECGTALARATNCGSCGAALAGDEKFCDECGAPLAAENRPGAESRPPREAPASPSVGWSACSSPTWSASRGVGVAGRRGDAGASVALFRPWRRLIALYGGTVEKFIGDAVMAVWGTPVATEDDAERAVRAALDLVAAVSALVRRSAPRTAGAGRVLTGEAAVTIGAEGEGMVAGDLVNTASRVQSVAEPGKVFVARRRGGRGSRRSCTRGRARRS